MRPILTQETSALREALYALAMAKRIPDASTLDEIVRDYPQYCEELTDFAVELAVDALRESCTDRAEASVDPGDVVSPAVSRAISRFHNHLYAVRQAHHEKVVERALPAPTVDNPLAELDRTSFRAVAARLGVNTVFLAKLRDRQIEPTTMTEGFRQSVADALEIPVQQLTTHLDAAGGWTASLRQFYKADHKPSPGRRQAFADAVGNSGLTEEQQRRLLSY